MATTRRCIARFPAPRNSFLGLDCRTTGLHFTSANWKSTPRGIRKVSSLLTTALIIRQAQFAIIGIKRCNIAREILSPFLPFSRRTLRPSRRTTPSLTARTRLPNAMTMTFSVLAQVVDSSAGCRRYLKQQRHPARVHIAHSYPVLHSIFRSGTT